MVRIGNHPLRVAIGAGHRNTSGGNEFETGLNGRVTNAVIQLLRRSVGFEVRCYTPGEGLGWFDGPLNAAAREVVRWAQQGWVADIFCEVHHEGLANPIVRGGFVIYPDGAGLRSIYTNPGDLDIDVRDFGGQMARIICGEIGVPLRGDGTMSERRTGVGLDGYRLGVFAATAVPVLIANCSRFITEAATYTNPTDLAIMKSPGFEQRQALGLANAFAALATARMGWTFSHRIGDQTASPPAPPAAVLPGLPTVFEEDLATWFGRASGYTYDPNGPISSLWRERGLSDGVWPSLVTVTERDKTRAFRFADGWTVLVAPGRKPAVARRVGDG